MDLNAVIEHDPATDLFVGIVPGIPGASERSFAEFNSGR
jgi:hypothetical protein